MLRVGQVVKAQILAIDTEKRQIKLSIKKLIPTSIDEYIAEHKVGDKVSGRVVEQSPSLTHVELGEGIRAICCTEFLNCCAHRPAHGATRSRARPVQPVFDAQGPLEGQHAVRIVQPRAPERRPNPHLQNRQARRGHQKDRSGAGVEGPFRSFPSISNPRGDELEFDTSAANLLTRHLRVSGG